MRGVCCAAECALDAAHSTSENIQHPFRKESQFWAQASGMGIWHIAALLESLRSWAEQVKDKIQLVPSKLLESAFCTRSLRLALEVLVVKLVAAPLQHHAVARRRFERALTLCLYRQRNRLKSTA